LDLLVSVDSLADEDSLSVSEDLLLEGWLLVLSVDSLVSLEGPSASSDVSVTSLDHSDSLNSVLEDLLVLW